MRVILFVLAFISMVNLTAIAEEAPAAKPADIKTESTTKTVQTQSSPAAPKVEAPAEKKVETKTVKEELAAPKLSEKEQRYQNYRAVIAKSFESVEEDEWSEALVSMDEVIKFFQEEKVKHATEAEINVYAGLAEILKKYAQTGIEIDKDVAIPDFDLITKMSQDNKAQINSLKNKSQDKFLEASFELIEQYIDDDLSYVEESKKYADEEADESDSDIDEDDED